ncbi:MAG TPA: hypothetical protein EYP14_15400 [Planctomycetaceae bacterium]|nr:hypothetical protein [Planctomycetaceae bacterium]
MPKSGPVEAGDYMVADLCFRVDGRELSYFEECQIRAVPTVRFIDAVATDFDQAVLGAQIGERRTVEVQVLEFVDEPELRGQTIRCDLTIKDLKQRVLPELDEETVKEFGYQTQEQLRDAVYSLLQRKLEAYQREQIRQQVLEQLMDQVSFQLPDKLIESEAKAVLRRRVLRLRRLGYSEDQIRTQMPRLYEHSLQQSARDLREHFVLSRIAEAEGIEVSEEDVDQAIGAMAIQNNTSPRRVHAQLNQDNMLPLLEVELLEQMTIDRILEYAEYEDVPGELPEEAEQQEERSIYVVDIAVVPEQEAGKEQPAAIDTSGPAADSKRG